MTTIMANDKYIYHWVWQMKRDNNGMIESLVWKTGYPITVATIGH